MSYIPAASTVYRTVTVTHTATHTVTAMPTQSTADAAFNDMGIAVNLLTLAGIVISVGKFVHTHAIPSIEKVQHWRDLVSKWKAWMHSLPPDQLQRITQQHPDLIRQLDSDLTALDFELHALEIKFQSASLAQRYNYGSDISRSYRKARDTMASMEDVWTTSTERYRKQQPFEQQMSITYPPGITPPPPPPPGVMARSKEQFDRLRGAINRQNLNSAQAKAMRILESLGALIWGR